MTNERVEEIRRRIECASCRKAPTDDPGIVLTRKNVKGVPGIFLCQFCDGGDAALAQAEAEVERLKGAHNELLDSRNHWQWKAVQNAEEVERLKRDNAQLEEVELARAGETIVTLQRDLARVRELLEWLNRIGGLGLDVHARIRAALEGRG